MLSNRIAAPSSFVESSCAHIDVICELLYEMYNFFSNFEHNLPATMSGLCAAKVKPLSCIMWGGMRRDQRFVGCLNKYQLELNTSCSTCMTPLSPQSPFQRLSLLFSASWTRGRFSGGFSACVASWGLPKAITMSSHLIYLFGTEGKMGNLSGLYSALPFVISHYAYNLG
jgi:hypothetical protein